MKKYVILLPVIVALAGCDREYEPLTLHSRIESIEYAVSIDGDSAFISTSDSFNSFEVKYRDDDEFGLLAGESTLSFKQQPQARNWLCVTCIDHGYPIIWK